MHWFQPYTSSQSLSDVRRDPVYALLYATLLIVGCAIMSTGTLQLCAYSDRYLARLLGPERVNVTLVQPHSVPHHQRRRYIVNVAFLVGLFIGALTIFASLTGMLGSGAGIMLAVTIIYSCLECRVTAAAGAFGL
ncbi:hypothetical protein U9M48_017800 [Paspalum notatum var. saurae]|uniref:Uncharacterized protein n=1 Tax=Paspalum notatum var. saurae TaxID=547442 RepID=A0AAQ3TC55_PASNO